TALVAVNIASPLDVRKLGRHLAVADGEKVDAANVPAIPAVAPALYDAVVAVEGLFGVELRGGVREDVAPRVADRVPSHVSCAVRCRTCRVEDAVVGDERQHSIEIVRRPGLAECL